MLKKMIASSTVAVVLGAGPLFAEPISIVYSIHITQLCQLNGCGPFSTMFPLTMTFDSAITSRFDFEDKHSESYGTPSFSSIPLEIPPVAPGASEVLSLAHGSVRSANGRWNHGAFALAEHAVASRDPDHPDEVWRMELSAFQQTDSEPALSAESMARLLGQPANTPDSGNSFIYRYNRFSATDPAFLRYSGFALAAEDQAPVPEPATCVLVGSALMGVWYRQRRKRS